MAYLVANEIRQLLITATLPALGSEQRVGAMSEADLRRTLASCFKRASFSETDRELITALLLLWHDHLDASHTISQNIENREGSFVHAIMHRREPDYWNAKYWWRRVGDHPAFGDIARRSDEFLKTTDANGIRAQLICGNRWNPDAFVDLCEQVLRQPQLAAALQRIQQIETEVLLDHFLSRET